MSPSSNSSAAPAPQRAALEAVPPPEPSRRRWWVALPIVLALAGAGWYARSSSQAKPSPAAYLRTAKAVRGTLQRTLRVTGSVTARNFSNIFVPLAQAPETGRALSLIALSTNGSIVKEGAVVAQIDGQNVQDHLDDVESMVNQVELDMKRLRAVQQSRR